MYSTRNSVFLLLSYSEKSPMGATLAEYVVIYVQKKKNKNPRERVGILGH